MNPEFWWSVTWKATLLLAGAGGASLLWRRGSAAARHLIWTAALAAIVVLPIANPLLPAWDLPSPPAAPVRVMTIQDSEAVSAPSASAPARDWSDWLLGGWLIGALAVLARQAAGLGRLWWLERRAEGCGMQQGLCDELAMRLGVHRRVRLLVSDRVWTPLTWGVLRPAILMPAESSAWPADRTSRTGCGRCSTRASTGGGCRHAAKWPWRRWRSPRCCRWLRCGRLRKPGSARSRAACLTSAAQ